MTTPGLKKHIKALERRSWLLFIVGIALGVLGSAAHDMNVFMAGVPACL